MHGTVRFSTMLLHILVLAASACAAETWTDSEVAPFRDEAGRQPVPESVARTLIPEDWPGYELGMAVPKAYDLGPMATVEDGPGPNYLGELGDGVPEEESARETLPLSVVKNGRAYLVEFPNSPELDALVTARNEAELSEIAARIGAEGEEPALGLIGAEGEEPALGLRDKAVVGNTDTRARNGIADNSAYSKTGWLAAIGKFMPHNAASPAVGSACTGTLISARTVLTAAHCVITKNASNQAALKAVKFYPRADNTTNDAAGNPIHWPWGTWNGTSVIAELAYDTAYVSSNCHVNYKFDCRSHDWALIRVTRPASASAHNVMMGYQTFASNAMTELRNKGYPDCPSPGAPASCKNNTLYGDNNFCAPQSYGDLQDGGFSKAMSHNCDTSPGHSGGPLYQYVTNAQNQSIPTIAAVHIADGAVTAAIFGDVNWSRRLTPQVVTRINNFK